MKGENVFEDAAVSTSDGLLRQVHIQQRSCSIVKVSRSEVVLISFTTLWC